MKRFFLPGPVAVGSTAILTGDDAHHILRVLRMRRGEAVVLFDGNGVEYSARIDRIHPDSVQVTVLERFFSSVESPIELTVAQGFLKEKKMDSLIRQLTEIGVSRWIPFFAGRSVSRPDARRLATRTERWNKIAREALKQCRRVKAPVITETLSFEEVLTSSAQSELKLIFWEDESLPLTQVPQPSGRSPDGVFIMLGPEGGFSSHEVAQARRHGFVSVSLGPRILRAETAAVAASVLAQFLFGDMGGCNTSGIHGRSI